MGSVINNSTANGNNSNTPVNPEFARKRHAQYFQRFLKLLPARLSSHDSNRFVLKYPYPLITHSLPTRRMTIAFFAVSGLDLLDQLDILSLDQRTQIVNWIYRHQIAPSAESPVQCGGFLGSSTLNIKGYLDENGADQYQWGHLAMTYTALAILLALGDDLSRLDRAAIVRGVAGTQREDGSFSATVEGSEQDMRFVYCAACICTMLDDWTGVDRGRMKEYVMSSVRYDYGISQHGQMESHGGTTFCALAALQMSGQLREVPQVTVDRMKRWLVMRQEDGFQGRPNKLVDTCYSFWIGAAMKILGVFELTDAGENRKYIMSTQEKLTGGFSKWPGSLADPFHSYFGICGLSFLGEPGVLAVDPCLNISQRSHERMQALHGQWRLQRNMEEVRLDMTGRE